MNLEAPGRGRATASYPTRLLGIVNGRGLALPALVTVAAALAAPYASSTLALKLTLWISFAICTLSLDFVWGRAGIFSFGQNALFGIGGYAYAITALNFFPTTQETVTALAASGIAGALAAAALGYFLFYGRLNDVYLSIVTLGVTLIIYTILASTAGPEYHVGAAMLGGFDGIPSLPGIAFPSWLGIGDGELSIRQLLVFAVLFAGAISMILQALHHGRFGLMVDGLRSNELRMELLGFDTLRLKLVIFVIGGGVAGLGGGLFAAWGTFINPSVFSLTQAATVVVWVMVGGRGSLAGAFVGVLLVQAAADGADLVVAQQTPLLVGLVLIAVVMLLPSGIIPTVTRLLPMALRPKQRRLAQGEPGPDQGPIERRGTLAVDGIAKHFGGVSVLEGITTSFGEKPIHAIIGPNGAGKSTFFAILAGRHRPDAGTVALNDVDVSRTPTFKRCRQGLGIKMQVPCIFPDLSVRENLQLAVVGSKGRRGIADTADRVGLRHRLDERAGVLSHGEQQWLEIGLLLIQDPSVILLDEPGAGMGEDDKRRTVAMIHSLSERHTIIVVEHDMEFIRSLSAPVIMLHQGTVFRSGSFDELIGDEDVVDVYLGRRSHAKA